MPSPLHALHHLGLLHEHRHRPIRHHHLHRAHRRHHHLHPICAPIRARSSDGRVMVSVMMVAWAPSSRAVHGDQIVATAESASTRRCRPIRRRHHLPHHTCLHSRRPRGLPPALRRRLCRRCRRRRLPPSSRPSSPFKSSASSAQLPARSLQGACSRRRWRRHPSFKAPAPRLPTKAPS